MIKKINKVIANLFVYFVQIAICLIMALSLAYTPKLFDKIVLVITMSLSGSLAIAMYQKKGKDISIINFLIASVMAIVFYKNGNIALFLLMVYALISSFMMFFVAIEGQRIIKKQKLYFIIVLLIFISCLLIYYFTGRFKLQDTILLILEFLSFILSALAQTFFSSSIKMNFCVLCNKRCL